MWMSSIVESYITCIQSLCELLVNSSTLQSGFDICKLEKSISKNLHVTFYCSAFISENCMYFQIREGNSIQSNKSRGQ